MTAKELAIMIIKDVKDTVGTICTCGIGTNLYPAKIALDIKAKQAVDFIGVLDEESYRAELWDHKPITDFWQIADGKATRLRNHGITTMREVAMMDEDYLYDWFGIDAELLIDHAWGRESTTISDFKTDTFGTNKVPEEVIQSWVMLHIDLRPGAIIERLKLRRPIYEKTAAYGHFGREDFPWEQLEETLLAELKKLL